MARTKSQLVAELNDQLKRDLANLKIKKRVTFHKDGAVHGAKSKTARNRNDRRRGRQSGWANA